MFFSSSEAEEKLFEKMQNSRFMRKQRKEAVCFIWNWYAVVACSSPLFHFPLFCRYSYRMHRVSTMQMLRARDRWVQFQMVSSFVFPRPPSLFDNGNLLSFCLHVAAFHTNLFLLNLPIFTPVPQTRPPPSLHAEDDLLQEIIKVGPQLRTAAKRLCNALLKTLFSCFFR